eukprot:scaffold208413_cov23-Cyclotella_meneghiniana.AAC.1
MMCKEGERVLNVENAQNYIRFALGRPFHEVNQGLFKYVEANKDLYNEVMTQAKKTIMESPNLIQECGKFDYNTVLDGSLNHFHKLIGQREGSQRIQIIQGDTQSKKTAAGIGVPMSMGGFLKVPVVVVSTNVAETIDLTEKMKSLTKGTLTNEEHVVYGGGGNGIAGNVREMRINDVFNGINQSGTLVIAATVAQVKKALKTIESYHKRVPGGHILLIEDEADTMCRTIDS